jgi:hypothetical protein
MGRRTNPAGLHASEKSLAHRRYPKRYGCAFFCRDAKRVSVHLDIRQALTVAWQRRG